MVIFSTSQMLHRVMPLKTGYRVCLTTWISGDSDGDDMGHDSEWVMRKKLYLEKEWRESILESHKPSEERDMLLLLFDRDIKLIRSKLDVN
jgi:hypothetical protein